MNNESVVFSYLASAATKLIKEVASKHDEHGEFLPEINVPHLHKLKNELLSTYCDLMAEIGVISRTYLHCRKTGKSQFREWSKKLAHSRRLEQKLHFDSFIDIGGDH